MPIFKRGLIDTAVLYFQKLQKIKKKKKKEAENSKKRLF